MATKQNEITVSITAGPNEMQLMMSLMRPSRGPYGTDVSKATSVHFTTDCKTKVSAFSACINGMSREDGSGNSWNIEGYLFDFLEFCYFSGYYNSKTRRGVLTLKS